MAVRHGYGKVAGTDALVFAYDTGDTRNSYKGEPTTNLLPNGVAVGHNSGAYGNVVTVTDATAEKGPGWKKVTISNRGSNFRIIQWTYLSMSANIMYCHSAVFDWGNMRDKGYYINHDGSGTGQRFFYKPGDYTTNQGASISINSTLVDGKIAGNITHTASHNHAFFINNNTTGVSGLNDYFYYKEFQVEANSHPTPFTAGTRSATQGLLDLTGNKTISLTNTSFDTNAQPAFDGTEEYFDLGSDQVIKTSGGWTVESIVRYDSVAGSYDNYISPANFIGSDSISYNSWYWSVLSNKLALWNISPGIWKYGSTTIQPNTWYHVALVSYDNGTQYQMYLNGVAEGGDHTSYSWNATYSGLRVRYIGAGQSTRRFVNGEIPVTKIYNRALTADEVRNNYRHYKSRFNI